MWIRKALKAKLLTGRRIEGMSPESKVNCWMARLNHWWVWKYVKSMEMR